MLRPISLAQNVRVNLISLLTLTMLSFGPSPAAWAQSNTAFGTNALISNTTGTQNSAFGVSALELNTSGYGNTATGWDALYFNTTGFFNTATGLSALEGNGGGIGNTATGLSALANNDGGDENTATGWNALYFSSGDDNTAIGAYALQDNTSGGYNIAVGVEAGLNLTTGSNNIDIGNQGSRANANAIRIGTRGTQTATYIAGINGPGPFSGLPVVVNPQTGQLAVFGFSSARYKRNIRDMGDASDGLLKLRPVSFRYKQDPAGALQYGLIAEEVERVYPELVTHGEDGKVEGVRYELLPALLISEVQRRAKEGKQKDAEIAALQRQIVSQQQQISALQKKDAQIDALAERLNALEREARKTKPEHLASAMP